MVLQSKLTQFSFILIYSLRIASASPKAFVSVSFTAWACNEIDSFPDHTTLLVRSTALWTKDCAQNHIHLCDIISETFLPSFIAVTGSIHGDISELCDTVGGLLHQLRRLSQVDMDFLPHLEQLNLDVCMALSRYCPRAKSPRHSDQRA